MIEYLEQLVKDRKYEEAIDYAETLLLNPENTSWDLMAIYSRLSQARIETGEYYGAQVAGQLALKMARELQAWDYFGVATLMLGLAYDRLGQPDSAMATWWEFITNLPSYSESLSLHPLVLYNLALVQAQVGEVEESLRTLKKATEAAYDLKDERKVHGIRHAMIHWHLQYGRLEEVPGILAKCAHYLRHNVNADLHMQSRLWHEVLRVRFAMATHRSERALALANRGLRLAEGWPDVQYEMHLLMAQVYEQQGDMRAALREAIRARGKAMDGRRYDLEYTVTNYVYNILTTQNLEDSATGTEWDPPALD